MMNCLKTPNGLLSRARKCPLACSLKIIFLLLFLSAFTIACFYTHLMTLKEYTLYLTAIGYIAVLALATHHNCRLKLASPDNIG